MGRAGGEPGALAARDAHRSRPDPAHRLQDRDGGLRHHRGRGARGAARSGGCGPAAARPSRWTCAPRSPRSGASDTCGSRPTRRSIARPVFGFYRAGDGRWIQIHSNLPHHHAGALKVLGCEGTREAVAAAVAKWTAADLENAFAAAAPAHRHGALAGGVARAPAGRSRSPRCRCSRSSGSARRRPSRRAKAPRALGRPGARPHARHRGPSAGAPWPRTGRRAARHRAAPAESPAARGRHRPRQALGVARSPPGGEPRQLRASIRGADVFCQSYRPGALAHLGSRAGGRGAPSSRYRRRDPLRLRARGPVAGAAGDSRPSSSRSAAWRTSRDPGGESPRHLPAQVVDHGTGYLAAFGAMIALARRRARAGAISCGSRWPRPAAGSTRSAAWMGAARPTFRWTRSRTCSPDRTRRFGRLRQSFPPRASRRRRRAGPARPRRPHAPPPRRLGGTAL